MYRQKHLFFCILLLIVMPCTAVLAQDEDTDTTVLTELDIKYDSILSKATSALTAENYQQAVTYYKDANALKPTETFPLKMIRYVEEITVRQKRADDLKRKTQIRDDLSRANRAIANKNWDSASFLFKEILTLQPEKAEEDYAKSKIDAIDLELKRIALRTPPKLEPVIVVLPKNRREVRAQRKIAQRNTMLAANPANPLPQKPVAVAPAVNQTQQKPVQTPLPQKPVAVAPAINQTEQRPAQTPLPQKPVAVAPAINQMEQRPAQTPLPQKSVAVAPAINQTEQRPAQTPLPQTNVAVTAPLTKEIPNLSSLKLSDSTDDRKLICQDITFIGTNAYIKVLIQNYSSTTNFSTDTLQVSIKKNNGNVTKLEQRFISSFPVIAPLGETVLVSFADASAGVDPADTFILEMRDKTRKTKLSLQIPWAAYQQQKNL